MKLLTKLKSEVDNVEKFVFELEDRSVVELTAINKSDGKWSICAPSQTSCNMRCRFCVLSELHIRCRNLTVSEIVEAVEYVQQHAENKEDRLLVSFMGAGEPTLNSDNLVAAMQQLLSDLESEYGPRVRFAIATMMPSSVLFEKFLSLVEGSGLDVKVHLSLHSTSNKLRRNLIPGSRVSVAGCLWLLRLYRNRTGNKVEVHHTLIAGLNDSEQDCEVLAGKLNGIDLPICLLRFNEGVDSKLERTPDSRYEYFVKSLKAAGVQTHSYTPPGSDIGSSCGQFLKEYYKE